jgi:hypothetical protein
MTKGPLAVRWGKWKLSSAQAGTYAYLRVELENAGSATWSDRIRLSYHWLDARDNPIVWDGLRTPMKVVEPGERVTVDARVRAPIPPGPYRFAPDLLVEHRAWFSELGSDFVSLDVEVLPREGIPRVELPDWVEETSEWRERVAAAHAEGYGVVAGSVDWLSRLGRRRPAALEPYRPGKGRNPGFPHPLLCPSLLDGLELERLDDVEGLPAFAPPTEEPWIYDGRAVLRARPRARA